MGVDKCWNCSLGEAVESPPSAICLADPALNRGAGLDKQTMRWADNWLSCQSQKVMISNTKSSWRSVTNGVPQGLIVGPVLLNVIINDLVMGQRAYSAIFQMMQNQEE